MKENSIKYNQDFDELHIVFKEDDNIRVSILDNGVMVELDENDNIANIVFPNFSKMLGRPVNPYESFSLKETSISDDFMTITLSWSGPDINIKLSI